MNDELFKCGVKIGEDRDWEELQVSMWKYPTTSYVTKAYRSKSSESAYRVINLNGTRFKVYRSRGRLVLWGLGFREDGDMISALRDSLELLKITNNYAMLNPYELKCLSGYIKKYDSDYWDDLKIVKKSTYFHDYYDIISETMEVMESNKWVKDKCRGVHRITELRRLSENDIVKINKLFEIWKDDTGRDYKSSFYKKLIREGFNDHVVYGLFYGEDLIFAEWVVPYGKDLCSDASMGLYLVPYEKLQEYYPNVPKKVFQYSNLVARKFMYEKYYMSGYERVFADGGTGSLLKHKKNTYKYHLERFKVLIGNDNIEDEGDC